MFIYKAMRYLSHIQDEYKTLDDAIIRAASDLEWNNASPLEIVDEAGTVILGRDDLYARAEALLEPRSARSA